MCFVLCGRHLLAILFLNLVLGMTDPIDDEENYPPRPRWIGWLIGLVMLASALGVANIGWRIMRVSTAEKAADALVAAKPELAAARKLVEGADCMRCHGLDRKFVGPGFTEIAQKYGSQADAQSYLADKIRSGSVGVWGNVIMPRHPQISEADALAMAGWVMSHAATSAADAASAPASAASTTPKTRAPSTVLRDTVTSQHPSRQGQ